ncbi:MAG: serine/threonine-protein kinase [Polyangiaceae bacterium]
MVARLGAAAQGNGEAAPSSAEDEWDDDAPATVPTPEPFGPDGPYSPSRSPRDIAPDTPRARGRVVGGRYVLHEPLGAGGYGVVYRATDLEEPREVALKILGLDAVGASGGFERFCREVLVLSELDHPGIVKMLDFGETEIGEPFIACEMLRGRTLEDVFAERGRLSLREVADIAAQVLEALDAAHARGIVHRDIKPSNVFLMEGDDAVKLLDFGVARQVGGGGTLTQHGEIIGTPSYMAPEQVTSGTLGPPTDLYALGLVMAEAITGEVVVTGRTAVRICMAQGSPDPVALPAAVTHSALGHAIVTATQKRYEARFQEAREMLSALHAAFEVDARDTLPPPLTSEVRALVPPADESDAREASGVVPRSPHRAPPSSSVAVLHVEDSQQRPAARPVASRAQLLIAFLVCVAASLIAGIAIGRATAPAPTSTVDAAPAPSPAPADRRAR